MKQTNYFKLLLLSLLMLVGAGSAFAETYKISFNGKDSATPAGFFTFEGKHSFNGKFKDATYDGTSYASGLKMESSTVIKFSTTGASVVTIVQSTWSEKTIKLDGNELAIASATAGTGCRIYTVENVAAGDHTISRGSGENGLFFIQVDVADSRTATSLSFATTSGSADINDGTSFTLPTLTKAPAELAVTYSSSNTSAATVNSSTGAVTMKKKGKTIITASFAGDATYKPSKAEFTLTVADRTALFDKSKLYVVKDYNFDAMGTITPSLQSTKAGKIWNQANSKNNDVFRCTNSGLESLALQAVFDKDKKGWKIGNDPKWGLYLGSGGGRCAAICDVKKDWIVEFIHNSENSFYTKNDGEDDGVDKTELVVEKNHHVYKANEDGMVGFEIVKDHYVHQIIVYTSNLLDIPAENIAAYKAKAADTEFAVTLTDAVVTAVNGTDVYLEDASAGIKLAQGELGLALGDKLNGKIILKRTADGAETTAATNLDNITKTAGTATPTAGTVAEALTEAKQDMYMQLSGVTVTTDGNDVFVNQGGKTIKVLNTLFADAITTISGKKQLESIAGIATAEGLMPTKAADIVLGANADKLQVVDNIAAFKALADKEQAQLTLTDAYVTFKTDDFSFVQDASGAVKVDKALASDAAGKKLNGYFSAQLTIAENTIDKQADAIAATSSYTSADGVFIPTVYEDLNQLKTPAALYNMVRVGRSKINTDGGVSMLETANGQGSIAVRDVLATGVTVPDNLAFFTGIVLYDNNEYVLAPVHEDSLQEYVASVTDYVVDVVEEGETLEAGDTKMLTGVMMTVAEDAPIVAEAKTVGEGDKQKNFTAKIEGNNYQFEATKTGTLTVYTEKQPKQKLNVTEDGEAMKDFTDFEQKLDSIQIPVTAGHSYLLSTTVPPLNLYGFTFTPEDKNALDLARNIATFKKLYGGMVAVEDTLMLNDAVVTYVKGDNVFVEDASGAIVFRETQIQFYVGQKLNGFIIGKNKDFKRMPILTHSAKTKNSEFKVEKGTAQSKPITIEEALKEESLARFVTLSNVRPDRDRYGFRVLTDAAGNSIRIDDYFNVFFELPEYIKTIEGIVGIDAEGTQFFWPTSKEGVVAKPVPASLATGKYYLKNVGSGLFWGAGNDWGTRGSLVKHAEFVTLHDQGDGIYKMESQVSNGGTAYYFEGDYMDNANPMSLSINKTKTEGVYTIASPDEKLFGYDGTSTVLGKNVADGENAQWQIISEDEMKATLDAATADNGVDATFLILDPNFGRNNRNVGAWTMANEGVAYNLSGGNNINNCAESYMSTFVLAQEVSVPNGKYVLNAQAAVTFHDDRVIKDYDGNGYPQITANGKVSDFKEMETDDRLSNMGRLSEQFTAGKYAVEPITVYVTDGKLTIGAKSERNDIWAIWDNFELTYYGPAAAPVETARVWDFTQWSAATVDNLKADAAASKTSGWSDVEKKADAEADKEPTEASKDKCFWFAGTVDADGELTANGVKIAETKGLKFYPTYAANRSLAIAVEYPETSLGTYAGPSYLWLGGGKNSLAVFTIPNVTAGSTITVEVESHKPSEGRGIELYSAVGSDDKVVADSKIGDSFTPKTKESYSWTVENDGDVTIYNTNGCHIYTLKVEPVQTKQFDVTYALAEGETHASAETVSIKDETGEEVATLTFGEAGGADFKAAKGDAHVEGFAAFTEGNGTNGNSAGGTFYIFKPAYDGKADFAVVLNGGKKFYIEEDGTALDDYNGITVDEKKYGTFTCDVKAGSTYKVYCAGSKLGFYGVRYYNTENPVTAIQQAPALRIVDDAVYNLRGQKVTGTLKPGLYIKNGKKIVVK